VKGPFLAYSITQTSGTLQGMKKKVSHQERRKYGGGRKGLARFLYMKTMRKEGPKKKKQGRRGHVINKNVEFS